MVGGDVKCSGGDVKMEENSVNDGLIMRGDS